MEPVTLSLVGGALFWGIDRWREHRAKKSSEASLEPKVFTPIEVARFTHSVSPGDSLQFDADICQGIRSMVGARCVQEQPIDAGPLGSKLAAWKVVPYKVGLMTAEQLLSSAAHQGHTVLGSLSLVLLPSGSQAPMLLLVGGSALTAMAARGGHFALLPAPVVGRAAASPPAPPAPEVAPTEPAPPPSAPVAAKNGVSNGAHARAVVSPSEDADEIINPPTAS